MTANGVIKAVSFVGNGSGLTGITSQQIVDETISADSIAPDAVGSSEIATGAVGSSEIATGAVGSEEIATGSVGSSELGSDSVNSSKILNGTISNLDIATDAGIEFSKIAVSASDLLGIGGYTAGTGVTINSGEISIGDQSVKTTDEVAFASLVVNGDINFTGSLTKNGLLYDSGAFKKNTGVGRRILMTMIRVSI